jgi:hypothetical protein
MLWVKPAANNLHQFCNHLEHQIMSNLQLSCIPSQLHSTLLRNTSKLALIKEDEQGGEKHLSTEDNEE